MVQQIAMPQLGESVVEGKIVQWFVKAGDRIEQGDVLLEVETDKANTEVPATASGYVARLLVEAGRTVDVGTPLIEVSDTPASASEAPEASEQKPNTAAQQTPAGPSGDDAPSPARNTPSGTIQAPTSQPTTMASRLPMAQPAAAPGSDERPWNANNIVAAPTAAPTVLPMAQRSPAGAAFAQTLTAASQPPVEATGPYGAPPPGRYFKPPVVKAEPEDTVVPFNKRRGIIAEHMVYSKHVSPHVPCFAEVDVTAAMDLRKRHKKRLEDHGIRLSFLAFVLKATCEALREYPQVNAVVGADEIIQRGRVHLGVAVETPGGLLVPVIRDADTLSVGGLAKAVDDLAERARDKKITADDLAGGTFTVSNPGRKGNLFGAAIINQPQVGILRMGEIRRCPVVREIDGEEVICIRSMMFLGLSYDHRVIDGVAGNGFLYEIRERLENASFDV